jgi:DNA-binding PadR family transcriptional regulator
MSNQNKFYTYYTARNQKKLEALIPLAGNWKYALVLDQLAFWSINSDYILPKESQATGWFCKKYSDMKDDLGYSESSLYPMFSKFESDGLIERVRKKIKGDTRTCIRITHKLLSALGIARHNSGSYQQKGKTSTEQEDKETNSCSPNTQNYSCKTTKNVVLYKEDIEQKYEDKINNITFSNSSTKLDKGLDSYKNIFKQVGVRLEEVQKRYIVGVINNLKRDHDLQLSLSNKELFAQLTFAVLNKTFIPTAKTFKHRMSVFSKLLREGRWSTPRGFYKYSDLGQSISDKKKLEKSRYESEKVKECGFNRYIPETLKPITKSNQGTSSQTVLVQSLVPDSTERTLNLELSSVQGEINQLSKMLKYQEGIRPQLNKAEAQKEKLLENLKAVKASKQSGNHAIAPEPLDEDLAIYEQWHWA